MKESPLPLPKAKFIRFDSYPSRVTTSTTASQNLYTKVRTIITDSHVILLEESTKPSEPTILLNKPLYDAKRVAPGHYTFSTEEDPDLTLHVTRDPGCACGSTLKSFNPYLGVPYSRD